MKSKKAKRTAKTATQGKKGGKLKIIIGFCIFCMVVSLFSGGGNKEQKAKEEAGKRVEVEQDAQQNVDEEVADQEEASKTAPLPEVDEPTDYSTLFIDRYNSSCRTERLEVLGEFVPHDKGNEEEGWNYNYRTEFRLPAYKDALGLECSIGEYLGTSSTIFKSMDVIYWPDKPHYRVYILDNSGEFATAFIDTIKVLHPTAFSDEFLSSLEEAIRSNAGTYEINKMIEDENFDMYGRVYYEDDASGFVEGSIKE